MPEAQAKETKPETNTAYELAYARQRRREAILWARRKEQTQD